LHQIYRVVVEAEAVVDMIMGRKRKRKITARRQNI
jgi:hypothetical protein